ncbi:unnamed protein product, partial [Prorocentrum cordatum]
PQDQIASDNKISSATLHMSLARADQAAPELTGADKDQLIATLRLKLDKPNGTSGVAELAPAAADDKVFFSQQRPAKAVKYTTNEEYTEVAPAEAEEPEGEGGGVLQLDEERSAELALREEPGEESQ